MAIRLRIRVPVISQGPSPPRWPRWRRRLNRHPRQCHSTEMERSVYPLRHTAICVRIILSHERRFRTIGMSAEE